MSLGRGEESWTMNAYHVLTWGVSRIQLAYGVFTLKTVYIASSLFVYKEFYYCMHVACLLVIRVLPKVLPPIRPNTS